MSYRFYCQPCDYWFDRKDSLIRPVGSPEDRFDYLLACPNCAEIDSFEETYACDGCGESKAFVNKDGDDEEFCRKCLESAQYYFQYEPLPTTMEELGLKPL